MKARLLHTVPASPKADPALVIEENGIKYIPEGTIIDHPDAFRLVHGGHAEAADDECAAAAAELNPKSKGLMRKAHDQLMQQHKDAQEELLNEIYEEELEEGDE